MNPAPRPMLRRWLALAPALLLALSVASPAAASPETLKRSLTNILFAPFDFVLSPITGGRAIYNNLQDIDDSPGVRVVFTIPGFAWNGAMQMGGATVRMISGLLELPFGLALVPFEADLDPIFAVVERADALVDEEYATIPVKIGINYVD